MTIELQQIDHLFKHTGESAVIAEDKHMVNAKQHHNFHIQLTCLKQEDTNSSYKDLEPQGAKRHPDAKKGGVKPPNPVYPFQQFADNYREQKR